MRERRSFGTPSAVVARLLAVALLLFTQTLAAALSGLSLAAPTPIELCGTRGPALDSLPNPGEPGDRGHDACGWCLACPGNTPLPPGPLVSAGWPSAAARSTTVVDLVLLPGLPRNLRPPGRAPPALS